MSARFSFPRYLAAKKSLDDRALNSHVWQSLVENLVPGSSSRPVRILEAGCGIGTMLERMVEWGLFEHADYLGLDSQPENIRQAHERLAQWALRSGGVWETSPAGGFRLETEGSRANVRFEAVDLFDFLAEKQGRRAWDLLVAHAFLDLVDVPSTLPPLLQLLGEGGLFYSTLNFDGMTIFEPVIEPALDAQVERLYHRSMDERITRGSPSGDSRAGRHLFAHLAGAGARLLAAGSSDWVVFPGIDGYPGDEAYFLHAILSMVEEALHEAPELDAAAFESWVEQRRAQVQRGELVYIAHQIDLLGIVGA